MKEVERKQRERIFDKAKRQARLVKYSANLEEEFLCSEVREDISIRYEQWFQKWLTRPRPLSRRLLFPMASIPTTTYEKQCAAFCGCEDTSTLKNLGCGHWMHPECLECLLCTVNHDGKDVKKPTCPLCRYCLERMQTDSHFEEIDMELDRMFEEDLMAAIQASLAAAESQAPVVSNESNAVVQDAITSPTVLVPSNDNAMPGDSINENID